MSLNDSEELSSSPSEEEEDEEEEESSDEDAEKEDEEEEEEDGEEEAEDSGSEVEIIEEVQGNGRLPPLQPTPVFVHPADTHFLPSLSEPEAAGLSLMPPGAEVRTLDYCSSFRVDTRFLWSSLFFCLYQKQ